MGKILITGATGNVGRYTAEYLLGAGEEVKAASKNKDCLLYTSDAADE